MDCKCKTHKHSGDCTCATKDCKVVLRSVVIPANAGDDSEGATFAPKVGAYYNTIVTYQANDMVYIYDGNGVPSPVAPHYDRLTKAVENLRRAVETLSTEAKE